MARTRTTGLPTRGIDPTAGNNNQSIQGNNYSCKRIKDNCCLFMISTGGYFALIIFIIYVSATRSTVQAAVVFLFGIIILPMGLKLCWVKVQKWQTKKQTLQQNAETFYRLSVVGRQNEVHQTSTPLTLPVERNQNVITVSNMDGMRSLDEGAIFTWRRTQLPPAYEQACSTDLPPTYQEAVQCYSLPKEEPDPNQSTQL